MFHRRNEKHAINELIVYNRSDRIAPARGRKRLSALAPPGRAAPDRAPSYPATCKHGWSRRGSSMISLFCCLTMSSANVWGVLC